MTRGVDLLFATTDLYNRGIPLRLAAQRYKFRRRDLRRNLQQEKPRRLSRNIPRWDTTRRELIRAMAASGHTTTEIWALMMDEHDAPLTYSGLNAFLAQERSSPPTSPHPAGGDE
ncbi:hypothetical protein AB0D49_40630 [Streptomyces sp. NPDC048290]|uniref:hypothetical protein n=1 Tax=Streptomyces sp. NPDC048290 TaxID=3155811 RepID=UPI00343D84DB